MQNRPKIILKSGKDQSLKRLHPWVFSGAVKKIHGTPAEGDLVDVYSNQDEFLGTGHYAPGSITIRILSFSQTDNIFSILTERIKNAVFYRQQIGMFTDQQLSVFRLIHAEGDGLPGLIADYYNGTIVIQFHSVGMYKAKDLITKIMQEELGDKVSAVYNKSESTLPHKAGTTTNDGYLIAGESSNEVMEYGNRFKVDWERGQKTGFYIDQRENRKLLGELASGKSVLNLFGYTGGFSVYALSGDASKVITVDSSVPAVELAEENVRLNFQGKGNHKAHPSDVFDFLSETKELYDIIIADPPAFAKHHNVLNNALQGYKRLNARILEKIKPGGMLFTFSCSQVVSKENFRKSVFAAAASTGRHVRIMHQLSQPPDHPVNIYHPEGEYLKGLVLQVE